MSKLEDAFPSPPGRPGKYVLYIRRKQDDEDTVAENIMIFAATYAARKFIDELIGSDDFVVEGSFLKTSRGIRIKCDRLREVMKHEMSLAEMAFQFTMPYDGYIKYIREGKARRDVPLEVKEPSQGPGRERGTRPSKAGLMTIQQIAASFGVEPRDCRVILRKAKTPKPPAGWCWSVEEGEAIRAMLGKALGK